LSKLLYYIRIEKWFLINAYLKKEWDMGLGFGIGMGFGILGGMSGNGIGMRFYGMGYERQV